MSAPNGSDWRLHSDRRNTIAAGLLLTVGSFAFLSIDLTSQGVRSGELAARIAHVVLCAAVTLVVWLRRPSQVTSLIAFAVLLIPVFPVLWMAEVTEAAAGRGGASWTPFTGSVLVTFGTAALAPGRPWFGASFLAALALEEAALWLVLDLGSPQAHAPVDEPWASAFFTVMAWGLFAFRIYHARVERELHEERARTSLLQATNDAFLAVRDLANTPLQSLELALALIEGRLGNDDPLIARARRALIRLHKLQLLLPVEQVTSTAIDPNALDRLRRMSKPPDAPT